MLTKLFKYPFCLLCLCLLTCSVVQAQADNDDNIGWLSVSGSTKIQKDLTFSLTPILRLNDDFSSYQNTSVDYAFKRKLSPNWSAVLLGRTWFIPDATNRQFLWPALIYSHKINDFAWSHRIRWHLALDIQDNVDPDFLRYAQTLKFKGWGKFQPQIALEIWWGLNGTLQIERLRYMPGFAYKLNELMTFSAALWRQESVNLGIDADVNLYRINLAFTLPALWKEK